MQKFGHGFSRNSASLPENIFKAADSWTDTRPLAWFLEIPHKVNLEKLPRLVL